MNSLPRPNGIVSKHLRKHHPSSPFAALVLLATTVVDISCWYFLYKTYNLIENIDNPSFAFDKIEGHFFSTTIQLTLLVFLFLCVSALVRTAWLLSTRPLSPLHIAIILIPIAAGITAAFLMYPVGGLDIFPYILKSKLRVVYNANPYIQVPLRASPDDPFYPYDHFPHHTLSYGPVWTHVATLTFRIASALAGPDQLLPHVLAFKLQSILFLAGTSWLIFRNRGGRDGLLSALFFAGNPLVIFELVTNGHNDGMMAFFLIASIILLRKSRWECLPLYTASLLIKPFPVVLLPLLVVHTVWKRTLRFKQFLLGAAVSALLLTAAWLPFIDSPAFAEGVLSGLQNANAIKTASISSLLKEILVLLNFPPAAHTIQYLLCALTTIMAAALLILKHLRGEPLIRTIGLTYLVFCAIMTNMLPWYFVFFLAASSFSSKWKDLAPALVLTCLGLSFYLVSIWAWYDSGSTTLGVHLIQALIITLPILAYSIVYLFPRRRKHNEPA